MGFQGVEAIYLIQLDMQSILDIPTPHLLQALCPGHAEQYPQIVQNQQIRKFEIFPSL